MNTGAYYIIYISALSCHTQRLVGTYSVGTWKQNQIKVQEHARYRRDHCEMRSKFRYLSKFIN